MPEEVKIIEQSRCCTAYDCDKVFYIKMEKGATMSDHTHDHEETVFLMEGEAEMILGDQTQIVRAPAKLTIPPNVYHKFKALTDLIGLEIK